MTDAVAIEVGKRCRELRRGRGLTLQQVADRTSRPKMNKSQVGKLELGAPRTGPDQYASYARALGVELSALFRVGSPPSRRSHRRRSAGKGHRGAPMCDM